MLVTTYTHMDFKLNYKLFMEKVRKNERGKEREREKGKFSRQKARGGMRSKEVLIFI